MMLPQPATDITRCLLVRSVRTVCLLVLATSLNCHADENLLEPVADTESAIWIARLDSAASSSVRVFSISPQVSVQEMVASRDARQLAFCVKRAHPDGESSMVVVTSSDGDNARRVGLGQHPSWSPSGNRLVLSVPLDERDSGVWIVKANGSDLQIVDSRGTLGCWSPDGNNIAYVRATDDRHDVILRNIVEDDYSRITASIPQPNTSRIRHLFWSTDGQQLNILLQEAESSAYSIATVAMADTSQATFQKLDAGSDPRELVSLSSGRVAVATSTESSGVTKLLKLSDVPTDAGDNEAVYGQFSDRNNYSPSVSASDALFYLSAPR